MPLPDHLVGKGATKGNRRALKHGTRSEQHLAPIRAQIVDLLRERYPDVDDLRVSLLATTLAKVQAAESWLETKPGITTRDGRAYHIAEVSERWSARAFAILSELEAESRGAQKFDLARVMAELTAAEESESDG